MDKLSRREILFNTWRKTRQEIVAPWLRRYRSRIFQVYILLTVVAFGILAFLANTNPYLGFDLNFTRELQSETSTWFGYLLGAVSWPGYSIQSVTMIALVSIFLAFIGLRWESITLIAASVASGGLNNLVKILIRRPRPAEDLVDVVLSLNSYSFPSGHTMFYTVFFGFLLFLAFTLLKRSWKRIILNVILFAMIVLVGPSRIFLGEHWASDVLGGYLLGSLLLIVVIQFYHWGKKQFHTDQPVAADDGEEDLKIREEANRFPSQNPHTPSNEPSPEAPESNNLSPEDPTHEHPSDRPARD